MFFLSLEAHLFQLKSFDCEPIFLGETDLSCSTLFVANYPLMSYLNCRRVCFLEESLFPVRTLNGETADFGMDYFKGVFFSEDKDLRGLLCLPDRGYY